MRFPRQRAGHIIIDHEAAPWALYRLNEPWSYTVGSDSERRSVLSDLEEVCAGINDRAAIFGVSHRVDDRHIAAAMAATTGARPSDAFDGLIAGDVAQVSGAYVQEWFIALRLKPKARAFLNLRLARGDKNLFDGIDFARMRADAAEALARFGPHASRFTPATDDEVAWLYARAVRRGSELEPSLGDVPGNVNLAWAAHAEWSSVDSTIRRASFDEGEAFQTAVVLTGVPGEFGRLDGGWLWRFANEAATNEGPFPVDLTVLVEPVPAHKAARQATRRSDWSSDQSRDGARAEVADEVDEERSRLVASLNRSRHNLLKVAYIVNIGADDPDELRARAAVIRNLYPGGSWLAVSQRSFAEPAIWASMPGVAWGEALRSKHTVIPAEPDAHAAAAPFCSPAVGDPTGVLFGHLTGGTCPPVLLDLAAGPYRRPNPAPGLMAIVGSTGSGKSSISKALLRRHVAAGYRAMVLDPTKVEGSEVGEWERLAPLMPGTSEVVNLTSSAVSIDPFRVIQDPKRRAQAARTYLRLICRVGGEDLLDRRSTLIAQAVDAVNYHNGTMANVIGWLAHEHQGDVDAQALVTHLTACASSPQGAAIFGDGPALTGGADFTVLRASGLELPAPGQPVTEEQLLGQGLMLLVTALGAEFAGRDTRRPFVFLIEEAWAVLQVPEGAKWVEQMGRQSRKLGRVVILVTQQPNDIPPDVQAEIGVVACFRLRDIVVADALALMGLPPDSDAAQLFRHHGGGLCVLRDVSGRVGLVQTVLSADEAFNELADTTPRLEPAQPAPGPGPLVTLEALVDLAGKLNRVVS